MDTIINWLAYVAVGLIVGTVSGLLGVGGGIIMVPVIVLLWKQDPKLAIGTSLAIMVPTAITGALGHYRLGHVNLPLAACLAGGAILGAAYIGAPLTAHLPSETLKRIFGVLMLISGLQWSGLLQLLSRLITRTP